jgi:RND family efflux transporter MFP subunit
MADRELSNALIRLGVSAARGDSGVSDAQLLERFLGAGDEAAFELLVWRHARLVFSVCRRLLGDVHDAEDAFQAVFLVLARKAGKISKRESLACWLYKVAYRVALTARGARARRSARERPSDLLGEVVGRPEEAPAEKGELCALVDEEVSRLPERLRRVVVLCYLEGKTVEEAARQLGCPRGTAASRLARARQRLGARLTRRGVTVTAAALVSVCRPASAAPHVLIRATARVATEYARGAGAGLTGCAAALAGEVLQAMWLRNVKTAVLAVALAGIFLAGGGLMLRSQAGDLPAPAGVGEKPPAPPAQPVRVTVGQPRRSELAPFVDYTGRLTTPRGGVAVRPRVSGRIDKTHVREGDLVKKGDLLFEIDPTPFKLKLAQAEAALAAEDLKRKEAARDLRRLTDQRGEGHKIVQEERDALRAKAALAEASYKVAQVKVDAARQDLEATRIVAPAAGKVGRLAVAEGDQASATGKGGTLTMVNPPDRIGLNFVMDERTFENHRKDIEAKLGRKDGIPVAIALASDTAFPLKTTLEITAYQTNPRVVGMDMLGTLPNPGGRLLPGMFVRIRVPVGKPRPVLLVPEDAVSSDQGKRYLLVVNARNVVERRDVKLGESHDGQRVIKEGLRPDEWVITRGQQRVRPGVSVEPQREEPPKRPGK